MLGIGFGEFAFIFLVLIIVLGPERIPMFMKSVGRGLRTLRRASRDVRSAVGFDELMYDRSFLDDSLRRFPELPKDLLSDFDDPLRPGSGEAQGKDDSDTSSDRDSDRSPDEARSALASRPPTGAPGAVARAPAGAVPRAPAAQPAPAAAEPVSSGTEPAGVPPGPDQGEKDG